MYLSDEEYQIIKQALDDAEEMQKKYSETIDLLVKHIDILAEVIIDNNLCEITMDRYNKRNIGNRHHESDGEVQEKRFMRCESFGTTISKLVNIKK